MMKGKKALGMTPPGTRAVPQGLGARGMTAPCSAVLATAAVGSVVAVAGASIALREEGSKAERITGAALAALGVAVFVAAGGIL